MNINQVIHTIQGEGKNLGVPSLLIRIQGCNLVCPWCDTKYAMKEKEINQIDLNSEIKYYLNRTIFDNIMITGGEPFLQISDLFTVLESYPRLKDKNIEIESNGTLLNHLIVNMLSKVNFQSITINISPKFDVESYNKVNKINDIYDILTLYQNNIKTLYNFKMNFTVKFVYEPKDQGIILQFIENNQLIENSIPIYVMTKTEDNKMNFEKDLETVEFCKTHNLIYTPRIHLPLFKKNINEKCD